MTKDEQFNTLSLKSEKYKFIIREARLCKSNFFYFLYNYVKIPYGGTGKQMTPEMMNHNMVRLVKSLFAFNDVLIDASRQSGKTTIAAALLYWYITFHSNLRALIISFDKKKTSDVIKRMYFIHDNIPKWLRINDASRTRKKESIELVNGSGVIIESPSSQKPADVIGRGTTTYFIYIDEPAFIKDFDKVFSSVRPSINKARKEAKEMGIPSFILMTSTPNGRDGIGFPWFNLVSDAVNAQKLFTIEKDDSIVKKSIKFRDDYKKIYDIESSNYFVYVKYHWSENKRCNPDEIEDKIEQKKTVWYLKETAGMTERKKAQDIDIEYLGSGSAVFPDETIQNLKEKDYLEIIPLEFVSHYDTRKLGESDYLVTYLNPKENDYVIISVDPAKSYIGDFAAIEVFSYLDFYQIGEYYLKPGSITRVSEITKEIVKYYYEKTNGRVILVVETNFGDVIENLLNDPKFDKYRRVIYRDKEKDQYGIYTNRSNRKDMISFLFEKIKEVPDRVSSGQLIKQISTLEEKTNGRIEAGHNSKDDCVMAAAFAAYIRYKTSLEYLPLIKIPEKKLEMANDIFLKQFFNSMNTKKQFEEIPFDDNLDSSQYYEDEDGYGDENEDEEEYNNHSRIINIEDFI